MTIVITGGAGFVGSSLAVHLRKTGYEEVVCLDNLKRRGSELTLPRLKKHGVHFIHGDIRNRADLEQLPASDVLIECSAEPSVLAGYDGSPLYLLDTNLGGAINCFQWAKHCGALVIFLSTSRVYPYDRLLRLPLTRGAHRFQWTGPTQQGAGPEGIAEDFPLDGIRSLYGASKLSAELILAEYGAAYGLSYVINRCGVITGPWQFGRTDQGVFMHWLLCHSFQLPLSYIGFGGQGKQVRDLLHIKDLMDLVVLQIENQALCNRKTYNVGGGPGISLSLDETTEICVELTGHKIPIDSVTQDRPADIPWYVSDCNLVQQDLGWQAFTPPAEIFQDMYSWIQDHKSELSQIL